MLSPSSVWKSQQVMIAIKTKRLVLFTFNLKAEEREI